MVRSPPLMFAARVSAIRHCLELLPPLQSKQETREQMLGWLFEEPAQRELALKVLSSP